MRSRMARAITTAIILVTVSSCATTKKQTDTPEQILSKAMGEGIRPAGRISTLPGADRSDLPYVPVVTPPEVARIWIYDHITPSRDLVVGHWIFIKLREEKWYIEEQWDDKSPGSAKRVPLPPSKPKTEKHTEHTHTGVSQRRETGVQTNTPTGKGVAPVPGLTPPPQAGR